jgi:hypothetical protein
MDITTPRRKFSCQTRVTRRLTITIMSLTTEAILFA